VASHSSNVYFGLIPALCFYTHLSSVADPGSGAFLTPSGSRMRKINPYPGPGMNIPDNFSESLDTVFRVKIT
jgi:hypothetical protein